MRVFRKTDKRSAEELLRPHVDQQFYLAQFSDLPEENIDPVRHYLERGARQGRDPAPWFSTNGYLHHYPDVVVSGMNPMLHYIQHGRDEGRPLPWLTGESDYPRPPYLSDPALDNGDQVLRYIHWRHGAGGAEKEHGDLNLPLEEMLANGQAIVARFIAQGTPILLDDGVPMHLHLEAVRPLFDADGFARYNPELASSGDDLLAWYCKSGWKELHNPSADFDVWWYWRNHLNPAAPVMDPLLHYSLIGKAAGLATRHPDPVRINSSGVALDRSRQVRRICLFAGADPHGVIDETVVHYLRQLSRIADVYYLADGTMAPWELDKLADVTKGAWSVPHSKGAYGSHAMLLGDKVGWEKVAQYDEAILADDSAYLVGDLNPIFALMEGVQTDWWGLQAGTSLHSHGESRGRKAGPVPMEDVQRDYLQSFEDAFDYDFALGEAFTVLRQPLLRNQVLRDYWQALGQRDRSRVSRNKDAAKLTQFLIQAGYRFDSVTNRLYPLPVDYSEYAFAALKDGSALFGRNLLTENRYCAAGLGNWEERLLAAAPEAQVAAIAAHLDRICGAEQLKVNLLKGRDSESGSDHLPLLSAQEIAERDPVEPKHDNWWVFPACAYDQNLSGNERAVFEAVRHDPAIRKIILTRGKNIDLDGANVEVHPLMSREGQEALLQSKVVFIKHSPSANVVFPLSAEHHRFIGLWHGIPFKRIGTASIDTQARREELETEHAKLACVISSSQIDRLAMVASFHPLAYDNVWLTGLPRHDFIQGEFGDLPEDFRREEKALREKLDSKKLVLFCPTFRNDNAAPGYRFSAEEFTRLDAWLTANNAVLGVREHMADHHQTYSDQFEGANFMPLPASSFPNVEVLYRVSDCLVTDYSSCFFDYMLTGKPAISFAYDLDHYKEQERGTFYDLETVFPGRVCRTFAELLEALEQTSSHGFAQRDPLLAVKRDMFFAFDDNGSAQRVVERTRELLAKD